MVRGMVRRISSEEAQRSLPDLLEQVSTTREAVILEVEGRPIAVLITPEEFERYQIMEAYNRAVIEQVATRNADKDPEEVFADVTAEVEAVRQELYDERTRGT